MSTFKAKAQDKAVDRAAPAMHFRASREWQRRGLRVVFIWVLPGVSGKTRRMG
jgi:hypothetical protein